MRNKDKRGYAKAPLKCKSKEEYMKSTKVGLIQTIHALYANIQIQRNALADAYVEVLYLRRTVNMLEQRLEGLLPNGSKLLSKRKKTKKKTKG